MDIFYLSLLYKYMFAVRLDESETATSQSICFWLHRQSKTIKRALVAREGDGQTLKRHFHLYLEYMDKDKKLSSLQKMIERTFSNRKSTKAVAICKKPQQYCAYICKDKDILKNIGFTEEEVKDFIERSYKKSVRQDVFMEIRRDIDASFDNPCFNDITQCVFNYYRKKQKPMNFHYMKSVVVGLHAQYNPKDVFDDFCEFCVK